MNHLLFSIYNCIALKRVLKPKKSLLFNLKNKFYKVQKPDFFGLTVRFSHDFLSKRLAKANFVWLIQAVYA